MKIPYLFLAIAFISLAACGGGKGSADAGNTFKTTALPVLHGMWVRTDYIQDLTRTQSPLHSANFLQGIDAMYIDTSKISGDSLEINASYNNHEGIPFHILFREGREPHSLPIDLSSLGDEVVTYEIVVPATPGGQLTMVTYDYQNHPKQRIAYTRIGDLPVSDNFYSAASQAAQQLLTEGTYRLLPQGTFVRMSADGSISGLADYDGYNVSTDFVIPVANDLDNITFFRGQQRDTSLIFSVTGDTLFLYETGLSDNEVNLIQGPVKYTLVRTRE